MDRQKYFVCGTHQPDFNSKRDWVYIRRQTLDEIAENERILKQLDEDEEWFWSNNPNWSEAHSFYTDVVRTALSCIEKGAFSGIYWANAEKYAMGDKFDKLPKDLKKVSEKELLENHIEERWWNLDKK